MSPLVVAVSWDYGVLDIQAGLLCWDSLPALPRLGIARLAWMMVVEGIWRMGGALLFACHDANGHYYGSLFFRSCI
jgi:hypothetical protein